MLMCIADVLNADELASVGAQLSKAKFVDGKLTAGWHAQIVKHNTQVQDDGSGLLPKLQQLVQGAIERHPLYITKMLAKMETNMKSG